MNAQDWPTLNERWLEILERLAKAFVAGEAQVDPITSTTCDWCGLQSLCRVDMAGKILEEDAV